MKVAFAGVFAGQVADRVRARLRIPCEVTLTARGEAPVNLVQ